MENTGVAWTAVVARRVMETIAYRDNCMAGRFSLSYDWRGIWTLETVDRIGDMYVTESL
jgi:hypothetical protein